MILSKHGIDRRALVEHEEPPYRNSIPGSLQGLRSLLRQASNLSDEPQGLPHALGRRPPREHPERKGESQGLPSQASAVGHTTIGNQWRKRLIGTRIE